MRQALLWRFPLSRYQKLFYTLVPIPDSYLTDTQICRGCLNNGVHKHVGLWHEAGRWKRTRGALGRSEHAGPVFPAFTPTGRAPRHRLHRRVGRTCLGYFQTSRRAKPECSRGGEGAFGWVWSAGIAQTSHGLISTHLIFTTHSKNTLSERFNALQIIIIIFISAAVFSFTTGGLIGKSRIKLRATNLSKTPICIYNCLHQHDFVSLTL